MNGGPIADQENQEVNTENSEIHDQIIDVSNPILQHQTSLIVTVNDEADLGIVTVDDEGDLGTCFSSKLTKIDVDHKVYDEMSGEVRGSIVRIYGLLRTKVFEGECNMECKGGHIRMKQNICSQPEDCIIWIVPWVDILGNYPMLMATWKFAPARAAGCDVVLKQSEITSLTCLELGELGTEAGASLAFHPDVDKIACTGSSVTRTKVMTAAAQNLKPVTLELGGKNPIVVFNDVGIDKDVQWTLFGCRKLEECLADADVGKSFLLQGGDYAGSFKEFSANNIPDTFRLLLQMSVVLMFGGQMPIFKVGRMVGQFAKPRSDPFEENDGEKLPCYKEDNTKGDAFNEKSRVPDRSFLSSCCSYTDSDGMIRASYQAAAAILNLFRPFATGGYAAVQRIIQWDLDFVANMSAAELTIDHPTMAATDSWTSPECLLLLYKQALIRLDTTSGFFYECSAYMGWSTKETCGDNYAYPDPNNILCSYNLQRVDECTRDINIANILGTVPDDTGEIKIILDAWANEKEVRKALHIRDGTIGVWEKTNETIHYTFGKNDSICYSYDVFSTVDYHKQLVTRNCHALIISGDHDMIIPYVGTEKWIKSLGIPIEIPWKPWFVDNQVAGYEMTYATTGYSLTYATVKGGGHSLQLIKPKESSVLVDGWLASHTYISDS
ncbi:hypothetical protein M8C21_011037 [Ambrosia artemisiifolia]|uniref:Phospho-2-dehydro-3-deoxyheptonate aldolase n=1 Tax=Ambrosia artemisiifolia TaxID=4212 RepID=A0AAD5CUE7_AMBAR|nr:hypothetical protein M8C21_011037 [Ambrosia artemisiifolia]